MKKLHELLGCKITKGPHVGIEIEAEGGNIQCVDTAYWRSEDDQSLRGRFPDERHEFVSRVLKAHAISNALDELIDKQKDARFDFSFRTSTHVHVNCTDMELSAVSAFVYLYYLLERDLMKYCGPSRNNNRFCLRMVDSEAQVDILKGIIDNGFRDIRLFVDEGMRYAACNLAALLKYGTIEFRGMRGTMYKQVLMNWTGQLLHLREQAIKYGSAFAVYEHAIRDSEGFLKENYGEFFDVFHNEDSQRNLTEALSLTIQIPFSERDYRIRKEELDKVVNGAADRIRGVKIEAALVDHDHDIPRPLRQFRFEPIIPANLEDNPVNF